MSIIFIDDILFNDNKEERTIRNGNCGFFMTLNIISTLLGLFYLYFYFIIPNYQNSSNSLSLYLCGFHLILNIFYFLIFLEFYLYKPLYLPISLKIITMFNPLIIFCIYYWSICLTHNLYVIYFKYIHNINKQVKFYKYLLFIVSIVLYIFTLINIQYNDSIILSKTFFLANNYKKPFTNFFYFSGLLMILYIVIKLYYIFNKKDSISINEYQENKERNEKIKKILNSVLTINLSFIVYFLITYTPNNVLMLFKYIFSISNVHIYLIDFITAFLISFSGTFIFGIRLLDPFTRNCIVNLILFNREFITKYKEKLLKENGNDSFDETNLSEVYNIYKDNFSSNKLKTSSIRKTKTILTNNLSLNFGKKQSKDDSLNKKNKKKPEIPEIINNKPKICDIMEMDEYNEEPNSNILEVKETKNLENEKQKNKTNNNVQNDINMVKIKENEKEEEEEEERPQEIKNSNNIQYNSPPKDIFKAKNKSNEKIILIQSKTNTSNNYSKNNEESQKQKNSLKRLKSTNLDLKIQDSPIAMSRKRISSKVNQSLFKEEISSFDLINLHLEMTDNLIRFIALSVSINDCRVYDNKEEYKKYYNSTIPWGNQKFYNEKTEFKEYNEKTIPNWIFLKNEIKLNNIEFKILSFCPFVFHHIRLIDNISIDDILSSLEPQKNMKTNKNMKVTGGRGGNSIIYSWDKKFILKTADDTETKILIENMIVDYHCLMKQSRSLLSRVYGVFKIELKDKGSINVLIQRNMNDLPNQTKLLTFDFKGSTVDRQSINDEDTKLNKTELMQKYKKEVLKDKDLDIIGLEISLNLNDYQNLISMIDSDSMFLQKNEVTDYSLIIFVHKYRKEDIDNKHNSRIFPSKDNKYLFNFAIVDFLGPFNIGKKGEKLAKDLVGYIKNLKDKNFSVLDPENYGKRFRNFTKRIIS